MEVLTGVRASTCRPLIGLDVVDRSGDACVPWAPSEIARAQFFGIQTTGISERGFSRARRRYPDRAKARLGPGCLPSRALVLQAPVSAGGAELTLDHERGARLHYDVRGTIFPPAPPPRPLCRHLWFGSLPEVGPQLLWKMWQTRTCYDAGLHQKKPAPARVLGAQIAERLTCPPLGQ
jgi:hypothetical protein